MSLKHTTRDPCQGSDVLHVVRHHYGGSLIVYAIEFQPSSGHPPKVHVVVSRILFGLFSERVFLLVRISEESNLLSPREREKSRNRSQGAHAVLLVVNLSDHEPMFER